jgi:hypothetical protein
MCLQLRKPALCRFWLHALVGAACTGNNSNAGGATIAVVHLMRFVFTYTSAAFPPHLKTHLCATTS